MISNLGMLLKSNRSLSSYQTKHEGHDFHSTQFNMCDGVWQEKDFRFESLLRAIPDSAFIKKSTAPHITLLYGLENENDYFGIRKFLDSIPPVEIMYAGVSKFEQEDQDVIKIDIISGSLVRLHWRIRDYFENQNDYPQYNPHLTLGYVKKNSCDFLLGDCVFTGQDAILKQGVWTHKDGYDLPLYLNGTDKV